MISPQTLQLILSFRDDRDWSQFHSARNLSAAIAVEASELLENFVWASDDQVKAITAERAPAIRNEIADIAILLSYLAHDLEIELDVAVREKLQANAVKYPVEKSRGSNKKYTEL
jgi:NTP pyrophosphatase (non-canonical NTP hydrolase)